MNKSNSLKFPAMGALGVLALLMAGCGGQGGNPGAGGSGPGGGMPPPEVTVMTVSLSKALLTEDLPGRLEAYRVAQVRARVDGIVEQRLFKEGSNVKAGATLFVIDPRSYRAAYEAARSDALSARNTRDRYQELLKVQAVSQQDFEQAEARLRQAEAALAKASLDLENTRVPAPISGHIGRELVTVGALVGHGDATNLAVIEQVDPIYANFVEAGADEMRLRKAMASGRLERSAENEVEMVLEDGSVYPEKGKLLFADQVVDPTTGSVSIRAVFPNHRHELLPGMFATIRFPAAQARDVIKVPQRAVLIDPEGQYVLVLGTDGKVTRRPVHTGAMAGPDFIIEDGLKEGDQIIVDGVQKVRPGMPAKAAPLEGADAKTAAPRPGAAGERPDGKTPHGAEAEPRGNKQGN